MKFLAPHNNLVFPDKKNNHHHQKQTKPKQTKKKNQHDKSTSINPGLAAMSNLLCWKHTACSDLTELLNAPRSVCFYI